MHSNHWVVIGGLLGGLAVILGAFAAHGLKSLLAPYSLEVFQTGVTYHFIHTVAILLCALFSMQASSRTGEKAFHRAAICFIIGILFFSGSLYALAITGVKWFGPITPIGGVMFILGWGLFAHAGYKMTDRTNVNGVNQ
ncbi:DUF423 domain-containing protein [Vibrio sp. ZSDZ34]|jgi:uncharacterized membrane protein YgdD (TMEM256/DUF423 family)|uniref:DUF423 domain-containing protein n=1 Tax=Vibrio gelatinilyticus TaxID=2893468 RepID=A0A9X1W8S8_9VIBR|nr:DUF423 domain-containing protein [Vibrio gelatinilyticus]MCJ2375754.1 DUF423 domain-containing protein [Vibrio gelatinilyticus]